MTMASLYFQSPTVLTVVLLLLISSVSVAFAKPLPPTLAEQCPLIFSKAIEFDIDATGGLNLNEFSNFWSDLMACGNEIPQQARDSSMPLPRSAEIDPSKKIYNVLLCQCHYTFHHDLQCCDDTATEDDDDNPSELAIREEDPLQVWTEVSLEGLADERVGELDMAKYSKEFCQNVIYALEKQGIELGEDFGSSTTVTLDEGNSTEVQVVVIGGEENVTSTTTDAPKTTTVPPEIEEASTTTTSTTAANVFDNGVTTVVTSTATEKTSTTTVTTTAVKAVDSMPLPAFDVAFVGSTNGKLNAASNDFEDVTVAFWKVSLSILEGMTTSRRLQWDFGAEAAIYFESVVMDVEDVVCPIGLEYDTVAGGSPCLQFTNTLTPLSDGPLSSPEAVDEFIQLFNTATNIDGKLYDALIEENPQTEFSGLGSPGKGSPSAVDEAAVRVEADESDSTQQTTVSLSSEGSESKSVLVSGMPAGQIVLIAFATGLVALVSIGMAIRRRRRDHRSKLAESNVVINDIEAREVKHVDTAKAEEWVDDEDGGYIGQVQSPTSSLAAMGVASTVATRLSTGDTEVMMMEKQPWTKNVPDV